MVLAVFFQNQNLLNVMIEHLPALEDSTTSETLVKHLNALHAARKSFVETEINEGIWQALRSKVRVSEERFENSNWVYYKRNKHEHGWVQQKLFCKMGKWYMHIMVEFLLGCHFY